MASGDPTAGTLPRSAGLGGAESTAVGPGEATPGSRFPGLWRPASRGTPIAGGRAWGRAGSAGPTAEIVLALVTREGAPGHPGARVTAMAKTMNAPTRFAPPLRPPGSISHSGRAYLTWKVMGKETHTGTFWSRFRAGEKR
jgi:hypothetical protein